MVSLLLVPKRDALVSTGYWMPSYPVLSEDVAYDTTGNVGQSKIASGMMVR